jgi:hypothetical protein
MERDGNLVFKKFEAYLVTLFRECRVQIMRPLLPHSLFQHEFKMASKDFQNQSPYICLKALPGTPSGTP